MKWFKLFDVIIQALLTIAALFMLNEYSFYLFYFVLGGWQVMSCILHLLVFTKEQRSRTRRMYEKTLAIIVVVTGITAGLAFIDIEIAVMVLFIEGCIMVLGGITMAVWYWIDCLVETRKQFDGESMTGDSINQYDK